MSAAAWKCCIISLYQPNIKEKFATGAGVVLGGHMRAAARKDGFRLESPLLQLHSTSPHPPRWAEISRDFLRKIQTLEPSKKNHHTCHNPSVQNMCLCKSVKIA